MAFTRTLFPDFALASPLYAGATVSIFLVNSSGVATSTLAPLYDSIAGGLPLKNPQVLDSTGKFLQPVYIDAPCVGAVTGLGNVADHTTGIVAPQLAADAATSAVNAAASATAMLGAVQRLAGYVKAKATAIAQLLAALPISGLTPGNYLFAATSSTYGQRTPTQVAADVAPLLAFQPVDADLTAIAALNPATADAGKMLVATGASTWALSGALSGLSNRIINGGFQVWQRSTSVGGIVAGTGFSSVDRFRTIMVGTTAVISENRSTAHPFGNGLFALSITVNTADAAVAVGDYAGLRHTIEGQNIADILSGQVGGGFFTVAFWARASKAGVYCLGMTNAGGDRSYVAEYTIATANVFQRVVITVPVNFVGGTWDSGTAIGLQLRWSFMSGSNFQIAAGAWTTTAAGSFASANQVNLFDTALANFVIADIMLVPGSVAPAFERLPFGAMLALCQRYFWKSFNYAVAVAQNAGNLTGEIRWQAVAAGAATASQHIRLPCPMRAAPTVTLYNPGAANAQVRNLSDGADCTATATNGIGESAFNAVCTTDAGAVVGSVLGIHATAEAEI